MQLNIADTTFIIDDQRIDADISAKLKHYMAGERVIFDEEIDLSDLTAFQQRVLNAIRAVPYSETITYAELAERIGNPDATRAAGSACGVNPVPVVIPCHRVVAKNGLGGYAEGVAAKKVLLELEGYSVTES